MLAPVIPLKEHTALSFALVKAPQGRLVFLHLLHHLWAQLHHRLVVTDGEDQHMLWSQCAFSQSQVTLQGLMCGVVSRQLHISSHRVKMLYYSQHLKNLPVHFGVEQKWAESWTLNWIKFSLQLCNVALVTHELTCDPMLMTRCFSTWGLARQNQQGPGGWASHNKKT